MSPRAKTGIKPYSLALLTSCLTRIQKRGEMRCVFASDAKLFSGAC
jgi:hypothetical protein